MKEKTESIKKWLGAGSINVFGLPMSGKDTVGVRLAELLGGKFLSSGMIIRQVEMERNEKITANGQLAPTDLFYDVVLPYFEREDLRQNSLILSSVGRWSGEEDRVMEKAEQSGHPIKAAIILNLSEQDVLDRWQVAQMLNDRGGRADDKELEVFKTRIQEFKEKTLPVIVHYQKLGLLVPVRADLDRASVLGEVVEKLYQFAKNSSRASA